VRLLDVKDVAVRERRGGKRACFCERKGSVLSLEYGFVTVTIVTVSLVLCQFTTVRVRVTRSALPFNDSRVLKQSQRVRK
jgi:hypothetical protein